MNRTKAIKKVWDLVEADKMTVKELKSWDINKIDVITVEEDKIYICF